MSEKHNKIDDHNAFIRLAIAKGRQNITSGHGGPFGAIVVKDGKVVAEASNEVLLTNDPTAHAEIVAIRRACESLGSFQLDGCVIYASCEPCPMCLGAIYWARPDAVFFAATREDASKAGFDDDFIYKELDIALGDRRIPASCLLRKEAQELFREWEQSDKPVLY